MTGFRLCVLRWATLGFLLALVFLPTTALASDCPPEDLSRSDCRAAASTARSPLVPIAGAAAGAGAGWVASKVLDREPGEGKDEKSKKNPCAADEGRLSEAETEVATITAIHAALTDMLEAMNTSWENTRQAALWRAGVDLAFIAQSIVMPKLGEGAIKSRIKNEFLQKIAKEAVSAVAKESAKDVVRAGYGEGHSIDSYADEFISGVFKTFTSQVTSDLNSRYGWFGMAPDGTLFTGLPATISDGTAHPWVKEMSEGIGDLVGGLWDYVDLYENAKKDADALKAIREKMRKVLRDKLEAETALQDALDELASSRRVLEHCRRIWGLSAGAES